MATRITVNGKEILKDSDSVTYESARTAIRSLAVTQNPLADGIVKTLTALPGGVESFREVFGRAGNPDDVIQVHEKPEGKSEWKTRAEYLRVNLVNKLGLVIDREKFTGKIFTDESEKTPKSSKAQGDLTDASLYA